MAIGNGAIGDTVDLRDVTIAQANALASFETASAVPLLPLSAGLLAVGQSLPAGTFVMPKIVAPFAGLPQLPQLPGVAGMNGLATQTARPPALPTGIQTTRI